MKLHIVGTSCNEYVSLNCFSGNQSISDFDDQLDETETINICKPEKRNGGSEEDSVSEKNNQYTESPDLNPLGQKQRDFNKYIQNSD